MSGGHAGDYRSFTAAVSETAEGLAPHGFAAVVVLRVNGVTRLTLFIHFLKKSRFCRKNLAFPATPCRLSAAPRETTMARTQRHVTASNGI
jgi:hypothetical protein